ncbi:MAG: membrane integrity-associated transporter subunit PqiC [Pseudomonadales bacterium]
MNTKCVHFVLILLALSACSSQPPTRYYNLQALTGNALEIELGNAIASVGIGPVNIPSELDRPGIVSQEADGGLKIASYSIWAGDLEENFTRVMASVLADQTGLDRVYAAPWDTRFRPVHQVRLDVQHFGGVLGKEVRLDVLWTLSADSGRELLYSKRSRLVGEPDDASYAAYVTALSELIVEFGKELAGYLETVSLEESSELSTQLTP